MLYRLICNSNLTQILDKSCFIEEIKREHNEKSEQVRKEEAFLQTLSTGISAQEGHENAGDAAVTLANYNVL